MTDAPNITPPAPVDPAAAVKSPALFLMVVGGLGVLAQLVGIVINILVAVGLFSFGGGSTGVNIFSGGLGIALNFLNIIFAAVILLGGMKMSKLKSYNLAMAASVLAMLPCSVCCIIGLPAGIWALMTLMKPEVKSAFNK